MNLVLKTREISLSRQFLQYVQEKLQNGLSKLIRGNASVRLTVSDDNGARGGVDKVCKIVARIPRQRAICITETDPNLRTAIDRAIARLLQALSRTVSRLDQKNKRKLARNHMRFSRDREIFSVEFAK